MRPLAVLERLARFDPADREPFPYALVPFDVPAGTRAIRVHLAYEDAASSSDAAAGNLIDLGLLGPGPTGPGLADFRGWSGTERRTIVVAEDAATPGYRPGPIRPGTWHVLLGLYRVEPAGCSARVVVECLDAEPAAAPMGARPTDLEPTGATGLPATPRTGAGATRATRWIAVDLHAHSHHSDGAEPIPALAARAAAAGLEAVFVTDHNTDAHVPHLADAERTVGAVRDGERPLRLHPGEEVTTYGGHLNALGVRDWVEFRYTDAPGVVQAIDEIHAQGGLASVNHPTSPAIPWLHGIGLAIDCLEIWNGPWSPEDEEAVALWDTLLDAGRAIVAVGGSDTHGPGPAEQPVGTPTTWVRSPSADLADLLASIRAGRVVLTRDPRTPPPRLAAIPGERAVRWSVPAATLRGGRRTVAVVADGRDAFVATGTAAARGSWHVPDGRAAGRVRLEVRGPEGSAIAITNHVTVPREAR